APETKDTIRFRLDTQEILYTVDMFRETLKLPMETPDNSYLATISCSTMLFHAMVNRINVDYAALLWWDIMNCVLWKKDVIQYPRFTKLIIVNLMKKYPSISLVSVYTTRNVTVQGMLIPDAFLTDEIRATDDYKEYETVFVRVYVPMNQPQLTQGTHRTTPRAHKTPTLTDASP
ncbi:hypothetical protein Tco_1566969, partial [Tanacetum coccineum]